MEIDFDFGSTEICNLAVSNTKLSRFGTDAQGYKSWAFFAFLSTKESQGLLKDRWLIRTIKF
jgi:hypothetical protein